MLSSSMYVCERCQHINCRFKTLNCIKCGQMSLFIKKEMSEMRMKEKKLQILIPHPNQLYFNLRDVIIQKYQKRIHEHFVRYTEIGYIKKYYSKLKYGWIKSCNNVGESIYFDISTLCKNLDARCCKYAQPMIETQLLNKKIIYSKKFDKALLCMKATEMKHMNGEEIIIQWNCRKCEKMQNDRELYVQLRQIISL